MHACVFKVSKLFTCSCICCLLNIDHLTRRRTWYNLASPVTILNIPRSHVGNLILRHIDHIIRRMDHPWFLTKVISKWFGQQPMHANGISLAWKWSKLTTRLGDQQSFGTEFLQLGAKGRFGRNGRPRRSLGNQLLGRLGEIDERLLDDVVHIIGQCGRNTKLTQIFAKGFKGRYRQGFQLIVEQITHFRIQFLLQLRRNLLSRRRDSGLFRTRYVLHRFLDLRIRDIAKVGYQASRG
mmetsp:Transcript_23892/g.39506  ORF Transcript_23892/g.39506 Transcript_23892/m.39506 type:complete len:238 (+) Transcript_23892:57-770(+)